LRTAGCAAMGSTTMMSTLANLMVSNKMIASSANPPTDYKALVCVLLAGGNDSFNMLIPRDNTFYNEYMATRTNLSIYQSQLLDLNQITPDPSGRLLGLHPSMAGSYGGLQNLFNTGQAAMVANVGTLIEPVADANEFYNSNTNLPLGLYSHADQVQQWQTATPQSREAIGWGGRMADVLQSYNSYNNQGFSTSISLAGRNVFQSGNNTIEFAISNQGNGVEGVEGINQWLSNSGFLNQLRDQAVEDMATQMYANVFKQTIGGMTKNTLDSVELFQNAIANVPEFSTTFSPTNLSQDLHMIAKTIAAKTDLNMCRQTFFVTIGGWDNHDELLGAQEYLLGVVSNAISEFFNALDSINLSNEVTLFTISDFARTLTTNGNGSDHAWGGNAIVAGGAVNGQEIYGQYPSLALGAANPLVVNDRGNLIPTTSADEYFAELALWFGVSPNDLSLLFPNLTNFYSTGGAMPLGFLPMP